LASDDDDDDDDDDNDDDDDDDDDDGIWQFLPLRIVLLPPLSWSAWQPPDAGASAECTESPLPTPDHLFFPFPFGKNRVPGYTFNE